MTLFLVPFVLIGIVLVFSVFHTALGLRNARPVLRANHGTLALGDRLELDWHLTGRVSNLRRLALTLEGQEVATDQKGTDTHTVSETFVSLPLFDLTESHAMSRGHTAITIPKDTMHSFEGGHNAIRWSLHLVGEIDRWPDLDERFPLVFLPLPERRFFKSEDSA